MSLRPFCRLISLSRTNINPSSTTTRTATIVNASNTSRRLLNTSPTRMATQGKSDISQAISDVSKQEGGTFKGSIAAKMQSEATKQRNLRDAAANEQGATVQSNRTQSTGTNANLNPAQQSQMDREANLEEAVDKVGTKLATDPGSVTKEDGDLLHSRETKVHGATEKGGIASQAQSQAAKNAGDTA